MQAALAHFTPPDFARPPSQVDGSLSRWHNKPPALKGKVSLRKQQGKRALRRPTAAISDRPGVRTPSLPSARPRRDWIFAGFLLLFLLVIYNSNFRTICWDDTFPARFLPFSLLLDHSLYLDQWVEPRLSMPLGVDGLYFVRKSHGHWMSSYPIVTPVVVTPLYILPAWWLSRQSPPLYPYSRFFVLLADTMEKLCASLIAATSGAILFLAFRKIASRNVSLAVALIYGLASNTWAISSQALWRHGLTELSFTFFLWALFRVPDSPKALFWAGLALTMAAANKPLEAILILAFALYFFARRQWKNSFLFLAAPVGLGSLVLAFNLRFFSRLVGGYGMPQFFASDVTHFPFWTRLGIGLSGTLVSPSRGLLVYTPWVAFAFWGAARLWKEKSPGWSRTLIVALVAIWVLQVDAEVWWAGWCFGPRYFTDLLPFFAWFLVPVWASIWARPALRVVFAATVALALWVQVVGTFYYPAGNWDGSPVNVEIEPQRCWDWSDTQIQRSWKAGPSPPLLLDRWEVVLRSRSGPERP